MHNEPKRVSHRSPYSYLREEMHDRRNLRRATVLAVLIHVAVFGVTFPEFVQQAAQASGPVPPVIRPVRFRKPDPVTSPTRPLERARRVPIPDPTPEDPEPLLVDLPRAPIGPVGDLVILDAVVAPPVPVNESPVEFRSDMIRPVRISGADPAYTEIARRARLEGVVILRAVISRQGVVRDIEIVRPLGLGLEDAAVKAVQGWRFEPATLRGRPIDVIYRVTVRFSLR